MKIRLMHVVFSLNIGGIENLVLKLLKNIDRARYKVFVCSLTGCGDLEKEFRNIDVPVFALGKCEGIDYSIPFRLSRLFKSQRVDLIHTHNVDSYLYGSIGAMMAAVPSIIHTEHSSLSASQKRLMVIERCL